MIGRIRKRRNNGFIPVSGNSLDGGIACSFPVAVFTGRRFGRPEAELTHVADCTRTAFGFDGAFISISYFLSGTGVIKSRRARAPSVITAPLCPIADTTVRVYALHS